MKPVKKKKPVNRGMSVSKKMSRAEKIKARRDDLATRGGGSLPYFIFKKDETARMRPLPVGEDDEFGVEILHFYLGNDIKGVISPASFNEPCAIMEEYERLKEGDSEDQGLAATFAPRKRYMVPHIRYKDEKGKEVDEAEGARLALLANSQYQDLCEFFLDDEKGDFTDPVDGYDIKYKRTGAGKMDTVYTTLDCKPTRLPKKYNKIYDPEKMVRAIMPSYEETQKLINKFLNKGEDDDDEDDTPRRKRVKSSLKSKTKKKPVKRRR